MSKEISEVGKGMNVKKKVKTEMVGQEKKQEKCSRKSKKSLQKTIKERSARETRNESWP